MAVTGMKAIQYDDASKTYRVIDKTTPFAVILALCTVGMEMNFYVNHEKEFAPGKKLNDYINRDFDKLKIKLDQDGKYKDCNGKVFNNLAEYDSHCLAYVYAPVPPQYRQIIGLQRLQKPIRRLGRLNERDLRPCGLPQSQAFSAW